MIQQNSKLGKNTKSIQAAKDVLFGTTGIALLSTAAVGVAAFLIWRNREQIKTFVGKYVDLPEFILSDEHEDTLNHSKSGNMGRSSYSSSAAASNRM